MSANKIKHEFRTILNLGSDHLSKKKVYKILRETKVQSKEFNGTIPTYIVNQIDIGMYVIRLELNFQSIEKIDNLKGYGKFNIRIFETCRSTLKEINLAKHPIFKQKSWARKNMEDKIKIGDLVQAIILCVRLERIKAFN